MVTSGAIPVGDDRIIENLLIGEFAAQRANYTRADSNPAFSTVIVCAIAFVGPSPGISTQAELQMR
jgi:hypothetical protein